MKLSAALDVDVVALEADHQHLTDAHVERGALRMRQQRGEAAARRLLSLIAGAPAPTEVELVGGPVCWRQSVTEH